MQTQSPVLSLHCCHHMSLMSLCLPACSCSGMNGLMCSSHALWGLITWTQRWSGFCGSGESECWDLHGSYTGGHSQQHLCFLCVPCTRRHQVGQSQLKPCFKFTYLWFSRDPEDLDELAQVRLIGVGDKVCRASWAIFAESHSAKQPKVPEILLDIGGM